MFIKMKKLSVDRALQKGQQMLNYPILALMIIGFVESIYLSLIFDNGWLIPIGFVTTFVTMWLWWSFRITKWRIWAFENCRNVHELKRRAIEDKLIWPDGSKFEKTEIRSAKQRKRIKALELKFQIADEPDYFYDDGSIPDKTEIHYSKTFLAIYWFTGIGLLFYGFNIFVSGDVWGYFLMFVSIFPFYTAYKKSFIKQAPIILSSEGIQIQENPFVKWEDIKLIENKFNHSGNTTSWHLTVSFHKKDLHGKWAISISTNDLEVLLEELELLIKVYQQRNKNNLPQNKH